MDDLSRLPHSAHLCPREMHKVVKAKDKTGAWDRCLAPSSGVIRAYLISKQRLVSGICTHPQSILQGQMSGKWGQSFPQRPYTLFFYNSLSAVDDACKAMSGSGSVHADLD